MIIEGVFIVFTPATPLISFELRVLQGMNVYEGANRVCERLAQLIPLRLDEILVSLSCAAPMSRGARRVEVSDAALTQPAPHKVGEDASTILSRLNVRNGGLMRSRVA